jgi:lysyl-tRNA synthetase class 2
MNFGTAKQRSEIIGKIREFFRARDVLEVETPILSHGSPADCHLDVFAADHHPAGARRQDRNETVFLRTSPEFHMKRLLTEGFGDIFQIGKAFRGGERGRLHNPEFTMLEWYRVGMDMAGLMDETAALLTAVLGGKRIVKKSYADVFREATGIDPLEAGLNEVAGYCESRGRPLFSGAALTDALQFAMAEFVEPSFAGDAVVFVHHYPAPQAVLAALDPDDERTAKRFEAFAGGMELVNGFEELVDWKENERRQKDENARRKAMGRQEHPLDRQFIEALKKGLPPCSGAALGLDRLAMLALGKLSIDEVLTFPWERC